MSMLECVFATLESARYRHWIEQVSLHNLVESARRAGGEGDRVLVYTLRT